MNVLELLSSPVWTGPAEPIASVSRGLLDRGHYLEWGIDTRRTGDLGQHLRELGFRVREDLRLCTKGGLMAIAADAARLRKLSAGFDVLHANFSHDHFLCVLATRGQRARRHRILRTVHSARSLRWRLLQRSLYQSTDGVIAVCEAHAQTIRQELGVPSERVATIPGAVDTHIFTPDGPSLRAELGIPDDIPVIGIVSRIKPGRRHLELLAAFDQVLKQLPLARLLIVGRGEGLADLQQRVATLNLSGKAIFAGYRVGAELAAAYRTMNVKVLLAEGNDGTCRALLEAMAAGRPGIAYRFGAPAEAIVHNHSGL
ncbi:MAG TPA: glycosyltransferase family 4 protein, partial [Myxococcaceae bacterium]|nr:glycosyltransferase family 4 protein [Myxococcaceae bacterium]